MFTRLISAGVADFLLLWGHKIWSFFHVYQIRLLSQGQTWWHTHRQSPSTPSAYSIVIFLYKIKPQSALYSKFSHQQQLSWMQLRQASRDKLHIKAAPDEIWSILIASGSAECLILLTTAADDIWGELHLTRSQQPERLYNYQRSEIQGDLVLNECRVAALKI